MAWSGCAKKSPQSAPTRSPRPIATLLIESKGITMPFRLAVRSLRFRPFLPRATILETAVIPPLNVDRQKSHGIAFEYASANSVLLLSEWPRAGANLTWADAGGTPCAPSAYKAGSVIWTTHTGLVMTLQPDGAVEPSSVQREARRLIASGACGKPG